MFSMGGNFLNSPGAALLHAIGINMPGYQAAHPDQFPQPQMQPPVQSGGFDMSQYAPPPANVGYQAPPPDMSLLPIPQPPHGGLLHRIASLFMGGGG